MKSKFPKLTQSIFGLSEFWSEFRPSIAIRPICRNALSFGNLLFVIYTVGDMSCIINQLVNQCLSLTESRPSSGLHYNKKDNNTAK